MLTINYKLLQNVDFNIRVNGESICFIENMKNVKRNLTGDVCAVMRYNLACGCLSAASAKFGVVCGCSEI